MRILGFGEFDLEDVINFTSKRVDDTQSHSGVIVGFGKFKHAKNFSDVVAYNAGAFTEEMGDVEDMTFVMVEHSDGPNGEPGVTRAWSFDWFNTLTKAGTSRLSVTVQYAPPVTYDIIVATLRSLDCTVTINPS